MMLSDVDLYTSVCLASDSSDVCHAVSRTSGLIENREAYRKTKIGTEVARVTRDSDATFKVKGQVHQAALLTAVLARQAAACSGERGNVLAVGNCCYVAV